MYVVKGVTDWAPKWKSMGWRRKIGKRRLGQITNLDLWQELDELWSTAPPGHLTLKWVKGHSNHKHVARGITTELDAWGNLCADRRACNAADQAARDACMLEQLQEQLAF